MPADTPAQQSSSPLGAPSGAAAETPGYPSSYTGYPAYPSYLSYPSYPAYPVYPPDPSLGAAPYPYPYAGGGYYSWMFWPPAPRLGTWALTSMICGAVSIVTLQWVVALLAVVFGFVGLSEVKKSAGQVEGRGFAIAGVVMGFVSIAISLVIVVLYILYLVVLFSALGGYPG